MLLGKLGGIMVHRLRLFGAPAAACVLLVAWWWATASGATIPSEFTAQGGSRSPEARSAATPAATTVAFSATDVIRDRVNSDVRLEEGSPAPDGKDSPKNSEFASCYRAALEYLAEHRPYLILPECPTVAVERSSRFVQEFRDAMKAVDDKEGSYLDKLTDVVGPELPIPDKLSATVFRDLLLAQRLKAPGYAPGDHVRVFASTGGGTYMIVHAGQDSLLDFLRDSWHGEQQVVAERLTRLVWPLH